MMRLIENGPAEAEWQYLVGESLIGERMIVPALARISNDPSLAPQLEGLFARNVNVNGGGSVNVIWSVNSHPLAS